MNDKTQQNESSETIKFDDLNISKNFVTTLKKNKIYNPTPIQSKAIPLALAGKDLLASAATGTGKTMAFVLPMLEFLLKNPKSSGLIMSPTRELAMQIMQQINLLLDKRSSIKTALLIGGNSIAKQIQQLKQKPRIIVGTPGRINDHISRNILNLSNVNFLVLDETDRMLDMGFTIQIDKIIDKIPESKQTLLFSATLPKNIINIANKYLKNPEKISISKKSCELAANIDKKVAFIPEKEKYKTLVEELNNRDGSVIIFMRTKISTEKISKLLEIDGFKANAIHGDLRQGQRARVLKNFRNKQFKILVATDVAARGLDIPHIEHVINYDLPQLAEDYVHRLGRTARAGATGNSLCFISPREKDLWVAIEHMLDPENNPAAKNLKPSSRNKKHSRNGFAQRNSRNNKIKHYAKEEYNPNNRFKSNSNYGASKSSSMSRSETRSETRSDSRSSNKYRNNDNNTYEFPRNENRSNSKHSFGFNKNNNRSRKPASLKKRKEFSKS